MRILLTGATGQIGAEVAALLGGHDVLAPSRAEFDLADPPGIRAAIRAFRPELIINPAAYTAVDKAESEPTAARAVNALAPAVIAEEARRLGVPMIHFSTDYVFSGDARVPYTEADPTGPINVYGQTKLEGEQAVAASGCAYIILRTSWVYGRHGRNFLLTMERLARERPTLEVVSDQFGTPNWARTLARATVHLLGLGRDELSTLSGVYHLSCRGETNWHAFAAAIVDSMHLSPAPEVVPIASSEYPTAARRPAYGVLDSSRFERAFAFELPEWRAALDECQNSIRDTMRPRGSLQ